MRFWGSYWFYRVDKKEAMLLYTTMLDKFRKTFLLALFGFAAACASVESASVAPGAATAKVETNDNTSDVTTEASEEEEKSKPQPQYPRIAFAPRFGGMHGPNCIH